MTAEAGQLLSELWPRLESEGVRAVIPRNYSGLPAHIRGDLDILVHPEDVDRAWASILRTARDAGWAVLYRDFTANHYQVVLWRPDPGGQAPRTLHLDLQDALGRKGFHYARVEPFLERPLEVAGFRVPRPDAEIVALALHTVLDKKTVREDYRRTLLKADSGVRAFASSVLPRAAARHLSDWVERGAPEEEVAGLAAKLRRSLSMAHPANLLRLQAVRLRRAARHLGRRRGVLIAFLGPDGAGKSTMLEATLKMAPAGPFPVHAAYLGKRDPFLPSSHLIRFIYKRKDRGRKPRRVDPEGGTRSHAGLLYRLKDAAGLINWVFEQWARYLFHVRPYLQRGGVVLTDRYAFDLANREDESWAHHPLVRRWLPRIFPVPDRTYLLWEDPEVLYARKKELVPERGAAFLRRFRRILEHVPDVIEVRTDEPVELLASRICNDIASCMEDRCRP